MTTEPRLPLKSAGLYVLLYNALYAHRFACLFDSCYASRSLARRCFSLLYPLLLPMLREVSALNDPPQETLLRYVLNQRWLISAPLQCAPRASSCLLV
jgi:hypothetical protein